MEVNPRVNTFEEKTSAIILKTGTDKRMVNVLIAAGFLLLLLLVLLLIRRLRRRKRQPVSGPVNATTPAVPVMPAATPPATPMPAGGTDMKPASTPKFCPKCGNPLKPGVKFCGKCGNRFY
jgi:hypothetical protein